MPSHSDRPDHDPAPGDGGLWRHAMVCGLLALGLGLDLAAPGSTAAAVPPYLLAILGCLWLDRRASVPIVTGIAITLLAVTGVSAEATSEAFLWERAIAVAGLLATAFTVDAALRRHRRAATSADAARRERTSLADRVATLERQTLTAADAANVGLWDWNVEDDSLHFTRKLEEMLGCGPDERITTFEQWKQRADPVGAEIQERISRAFARGEHSGHFIAQYHVDLPDDTRRYFVTRAGPRFDADGAPIGLTGADTDVTELHDLTQELRRTRDEAEAASRAKSSFLANMSHELRTPLNSIIGFSQAMEGKSFGPIPLEKFPEYAGDIRVAGEHLLGVINDILDISKIESGEILPDPQTVAVTDALKTVIRLCQPEADAKRLTIDLESPGEATLHVDPRHLSQIGVNLVSNAIKFSPEGATVSVKAAVSPQGQMIITVSDRGIGIPPEDLDRVMEPFQQVAESYARGYQGTGLGLSIARSLAEINGGILFLESEPDQGTRAVLRFPTPPVTP